eukprot:15434490-Alexandrium_andersonii.AAC.1
MAHSLFAISEEPSSEVDVLDLEGQWEQAEQWLASDDMSCDALAVQYHKGSKEVNERHLSLEQRAQVDVAKTLEWDTLLDKGAMVVITGERAAQVRAMFGDRVIQSRFVLTWKQEAGVPGRYKARWCLRGHQDPDTLQLVTAGRTSSPTVSQLARNLTTQ